MKLSVVPVGGVAPFDARLDLDGSSQSHGDDARDAMVTCTPGHAVTGCRSRQAAEQLADKAG